MARPSRTAEREIADLEDSIAEAQGDLDFLAALAERCTTDASRREIRRRIERKLRRLADLQQRRADIREELK